MIETTVLPTVGEDTDRQYVCITLQVCPSDGYPDIQPVFHLRNPRGLDDHSINEIHAAVRQKLVESIGMPVVFDLIEIIRDRLTESNLPSGQCVVCLYGFQDGDEFTKTVCYHYLHSYCLARHLTALQRNYQEELNKMPAWQRQTAKPFQPCCPVCREAITNDLEPLRLAKAPAELQNAPRFEVTNALKMLQAKMSTLFLLQKSRGGIIDVSAEEANVISIGPDERELHQQQQQQRQDEDAAAAEMAAATQPTKSNRQYSTRNHREKVVATSTPPAPVKVEQPKYTSVEEDEPEERHRRHHHHDNHRRGGNRHNRRRQAHTNSAASSESSGNNGTQSPATNQR